MNTFVGCAPPRTLMLETLAYENKTWVWIFIAVLCVIAKQLRHVNVYILLESHLTACFSVERKYIYIKKLRDHKILKVKGKMCSIESYIIYINLKNLHTIYTHTHICTNVHTHTYMCIHSVHSVGMYICMRSEN